VFAASVILSINMQDIRVLNSVEAGRRLMLRAAVYPLVAVAVLALVLLLLAGPKAALGAGIGGAAMTLGSLVAALGAFGGGVSTAGLALGRLLLGMAAKWVVVIAGLLLAIGVWHLPPLAVLAGAASAAVALLVATKLWA
jgi:F0F1-type ATP synthase assembly protein I